MQSGGGGTKMQSGGGGVALILETAMEKSVRWKGKQLSTYNKQYSNQLHGRQSYPSWQLNVHFEQMTFIIWH